MKDINQARKLGCRLGLAAALVVGTLGTAYAQEKDGDHMMKPPKEAAPIDLTGYWVSIVNEDWRWRMVTPPKGDTASVPLNDAGREAAMNWDPSTDGSCKAFGAAGVMRMPTRVHITWEGDDVLKIETDNGEQVRRLNFGAPTVPSGAFTLQGYSHAQWETGQELDNTRAGRRRGPGQEEMPPPESGDLKVETTNLAPGWLRRNGVPYSDSTTMTEYYDTFTGPAGKKWFVVTTVVQDPKYLNGRFITSSHFRKEPNGSKWDPQPCKQ